MIPYQKIYILNELINKFQLINPEYILPLNFKSNILFRINLNKLDIDIKRGYPKYYYNQNGIYAIQLRPISNKERTLIIGCGNNPTSLYYHYPYKNCNISNKCRCEKNHLHKGCVTIDPDISMNPTIVSMFGKTKLTFLKDSSFDRILTENLNISHFKSFKKEKKRLLIK